MDTAGDEEQRVHARGPAVVGMEDMGPQVRGAGSGAFDVEGALGRRGEGEVMDTTVSGSAGKGRLEDEDEDEEGYVVIDNVDMEEADKEEGDMDTTTT